MTEIVISVELGLLVSLGIYFLYQIFYKKCPIIRIPDIKIPRIEVPPIILQIPEIQIPKISVPNIEIPPVEIPSIHITLQPEFIWPANQNVPEMVKLLKKDQSGTWVEFARCRSTHNNVQEAINKPGLAIERGGEIIEGVQ